MSTNFYLVPPKMNPIADYAVQPIFIGVSGRSMKACEIAGHILHTVDAWMGFIDEAIEYGWHVQDEYGKWLKRDELYEWFDPHKPSRTAPDYSGDIDGWADGTVWFSKHLSG